MQTVLVTGAGGFIGSHVVRRFVQTGAAVRASDLPSADLAWAAELGAEVVPADLTDDDDAERAVAGSDVVVHAAGLFDFAAGREAMERVNVQATRSCCEAALRHGVGRFVHLSSVAVYGVPAASPCPEDTLKRPRSAYQQTKWEGERVAMGYHTEHGLPVVALRPALVYGPGSRYGHAMYAGSLHVLRYWDQAYVPILAGGPVSNQVHVDDVVGAAVLLTQADGVAGRAFNVADAGRASLEEMSAMYVRECGLAQRRLPGWTRPLATLGLRAASPLLRRWLDRLNASLARTWPRIVERFGLVPALRPRFDEEWLSYLHDDHLYDTTALGALGWQPQHPSFLDGMPETIAWYREQRWLPTLTELESAVRERRASAGSGA